MQKSVSVTKFKNKTNPLIALKKDLTLNKCAYLMLAPVILYYLIFQYFPLYGAQIAFKDFEFSRGIIGSKFIGFENFVEFFNAFYFWRIIRNTIVLSLYNIVFGFPAPIILALLINEVKSTTFKRITQTLTYLPHFISMVVICGLILDFTSRGGVVNDLLHLFGVPPTAFMLEPQWFRTIYVSTDIWQQVGWGSIIYLAALTGINQELYEACNVDGAGRWKQLITVTLPGIAPTIIIMLILRMGKLMDVGLEKVMLLYNSNTYETADIISTFVYRKGLIDMSYSYSAAVGLFNSAICFVFLIIVNNISRRVNETSLW
ncbi:MAG TPA: ABC transporter permease subunit [Ruminiclostridium sp.]